MRHSSDKLDKFRHWTKSPLDIRLMERISCFSESSALKILENPINIPFSAIGMWRKHLSFYPADTDDDSFFQIFRGQADVAQVLASRYLGHIIPAMGSVIKRYGRLKIRLKNYGCAVLVYPSHIAPGMATPASRPRSKRALAHPLDDITDGAAFPEVQKLERFKW